jgi:hypothetical protein
MSDRKWWLVLPDTPAPERPDAQSLDYNRGWADGNAYALDACNPIIERLSRAAAPVTDAGLDVERLAEAMDNFYGSLEWMGDPLSRDADHIAAEYAALSRQAEKETA